MRAALELGLLRLLRWYTLHPPFDKGKWRLYQTALRLCRHPPRDVVVATKFGTRLCVDLTTGMQEGVFFFGEYEPALSRVVAARVKPGDVCLDVGANFGWYTLLFHRLCGPSGAVHAFEPVPSSFRQLERNADLAGRPANLFLNQIALGDRSAAVELHVFAGLPTGHASLALHGRGDAVAVAARMTTLDAYLAQRGAPNVACVKVDIEGAEAMFLRGATRLFAQSAPPILLIEMALATTKSFGYLPNDLITFIRARARYEFFAIDERTHALVPISGFAAHEIGANVLCVPRAGAGEASPRD